ncbi:39693_t:CDS:2 [Gigaspora margarita]|uniref:39693_t:CDS:1 n=1 Tax=Gigaspora margarita TaxID=4874 RepID=A0ABN7UI66_GIGMA|nr:39693_t:CDS:2 [Gigaspora margarita]
MPPPYPSFTLPTSLLPITSTNPAMRPKRYFNVNEAKKSGSIDYIQIRSTRYKVYSLFEKMGGSIMLSEIPQLYLEEYNRALEYQGKLTYVIENEFPGVFEFIQALPGNQTVVILKQIWENAKEDVVKAQKRDISSVATCNTSLDHKKHKTNSQEVIKINYSEIGNDRVNFLKISELQRDVLELLFFY